MSDNHKSAYGADLKNIVSTAKAQRTRRNTKNLLLMIIGEEALELILFPTSFSLSLLRVFRAFALKIFLPRNL